MLKKRRKISNQNLILYFKELEKEQIQPKSSSTKKIVKKKIEQRKLENRKTVEKNNKTKC